MKQTCILSNWLGSLLRQSLLFLKQPHIDRSIDIIYMHMYIYVYTYIRIYIYILQLEQLVEALLTLMIDVDRLY